MKKSPLISVIIPTFNREKLVVRAVRSVLEQSYDNLELHLVDDGSSDMTREVCTPFFNDSRFNYHFQENQGQSVARNLGIELSQGELIALLDSDNYWLPDKLKNQVSFFQNHQDSHILYSDGCQINEEGKKLFHQPVARHSGMIIQQLIKRNFISNNTVLVKKKCFEEMGGFDTNLRFAEDYDLWLRFATRYKFLYHPQEVVCYCIEGDRLSAQESRVIAANYKIYKRFFEDYPDVVPRIDRREAWSGFYRWRSQVVSQEDKIKAWADLVHALVLSPVDSRNWRAIARLILR